MREFQVITVLTGGVGNQVYVVGGLLAGTPISATRGVEVYDVANDEWSQVALMPFARDHMARKMSHEEKVLLGGAFALSGDWSSAKALLPGTLSPSKSGIIEQRRHAVKQNILLHVGCCTQT